MVIRLIGQIRYCSVCITILACITVTGLAVISNKHMPYRFVFLPNMHSTLQQDFQQTLAAVLANDIHMSAQTVHETIKQQYPNIAEIKISTAHYPQAQTVLTITQEKPYLIINDTLVLTEKEHQTSIKAYPVGLQENTIHVTSDSTNEKDVHDLYVFIKTLPAEMLQNYTISWHNKTLIELRHITQPYRIRATGTTAFNAPLLQALAAVMEYVETKKESSKNKTAQWVMDVRYKNQIILARQKGEN